MKAFDCNFKLTVPMLTAAAKQGHKAVGRYVDPDEISDLDKITPVPYFMDNSVAASIIRNSGLDKPELWIKRLDTIPYFKAFVIHIYTKGKKDGVT
jgi:hypothetical protein